MNQQELILAALSNWDGWIMSEKRSLTMEEEEMRFELIARLKVQPKREYCAECGHEFKDGPCAYCEQYGGCCVGD